MGLIEEPHRPTQECSGCLEVFGDLVDRDKLTGGPEDDDRDSDQVWQDRLFAWWSRRRGVLVHDGLEKRRRGSLS